MDVEVSQLSFGSVNPSYKLVDGLRKDCVSAFSARAVESAEENYSTGSTYLLRASDAPKSGLEALARAIFEKHTAGKDYDPNNSYAEWWTQVISRGDDIGMHWDRDYALEEDEGIHKYPDFATVTYISDSHIGAPTVIFNHPGTENAAEDITTHKINEAVICGPQRFRHLRFCGRYLHCAPACLNSQQVSNHDDEIESDDSDFERVFSDDDDDDDADEGSVQDTDSDRGFSGISRGREPVIWDSVEPDFSVEELRSHNHDDDDSPASDETRMQALMRKRHKKRITFLVNIWLNHRPSQASEPPSHLVNEHCSTSSDCTKNLQWQVQLRSEPSSASAATSAKALPTICLNEAVRTEDSSAVQDANKKKKNKKPKKAPVELFKVKRLRFVHGDDRYCVVWPVPNEKLTLALLGSHNDNGDLDARVVRLDYDTCGTAEAEKKHAISLQLSRKQPVPSDSEDEEDSEGEEEGEDEDEEDEEEEGDEEEGEDEEEEEVVAPAPKRQRKK